MDLILEVRTGRDRVTMACSGQLVGGKEIEAFRRSAFLLLGGFDRLTINLAGVRHADHEGWNGLAAVLATGQARGKQVKITHAAHLHMPDIAGFENLLGLHEQQPQPIERAVA